MALFSEHSDTAADIAAKVMPPVAVSGLTLFGVSIPELVQLVTLIYVSVMIIDKIYIIALRHLDTRKKESSKE